MVVEIGSLGVVVVELSNLHSTAAKFCWRCAAIRCVKQFSGAVAEGRLGGQPDWENYLRVRPSRVHPRIDR